MDGKDDHEGAAGKGGVWSPNLQVFIAKLSTQVHLIGQDYAPRQAVSIHPARAEWPSLHCPPPGPAETLSPRTLPNRSVVGISDALPERQCPST